MKLLEEYLKKLNIPYDNTTIDKFLKYYELLIHYNKMFNLTSITEKEEVIIKHFVDSLYGYSSNVGRDATALAVEISKVFLFFEQKSSTLVCMAVTFERLSSSLTIFKKFILLFRLSIKVKLTSLKTIASGIDGKPAPAPTSTTLLFFLKN